MASNPQIIADLKVIMEKDQPLELLSTYKGVPFICKAKVEDINGESVRLISQDHSLICLAREALAKVLGSDYFEPATAEIENVSVSCGEIRLTNFTYLGAKLGERMIVRVEPKEPTPVILESAEIKTSGELVDISISGLGLRVSHASYNSMLKPGTNIQIKMNIPSADINVAGSILSAFKTEEYYRLSIRFGPDISQRSLIFKYLIDRRHEIEREVHDVFHNCVQQGN